MAKIGVVGEKDFALLFTAVGLDVFFESTPESVNRRVHRLAREGYASIFVQEKFYDGCRETIDEYAGEVYPAIIPIPDSRGSLGTGITKLKANVEKAVGVDILFNN